MLDRTGKPSPRLRASVLREELEGRLDLAKEYFANGILDRACFLFSLIHMLCLTP